MSNEQANEHADGPFLAGKKGQEKQADAATPGQKEVPPAEREEPLALSDIHGPLTVNEPSEFDADDPRATL